MSENAMRLCALDDIADGDTAAFTTTVEGQPTAVLAVRRRSEVFVYVNSCPHIGSPLDFTPGQFLNLEKTHIQCSTHGALFQIEDGLCVAGPCQGKHLEPVAASVRDGEVLL